MVPGRFYHLAEEDETCERVLRRILITLQFLVWICTLSEISRETFISDVPSGNHFLGADDSDSLLSPFRSNNLENHFCIAYEHHYRTISLQPRRYLRLSWSFSVC